MPRLQDWDLAIRLLLNGKLSYIDDILVDQYIQNDSITLKPEKLVAAYELLANKYSALYDEYPNSYSAFYTGFSGAYLLNGQYDKALNAARRSLAKKLTLKGAIRYLQAMLTSVTRWGGIV